MTRRGAPPRPRAGGGPGPSRSHGSGPVAWFPGIRDIIDPRGPYLLPLLLLVVARVIAWIVLPLAAEDAFITFRYARNLAAGNGLVYNVGERVLGITSTPWALWNAVGILALKDPILWSRITNLLADAVTVLIMGHLLRRHAGIVAAACFTFFLAAWPFFAVVSASGMESSVFLALIALTAALAEVRHPAAGPALACVAWIRPEGLAAAFVLTLYMQWRDRIVAAVLLAIALGATWAYYGTVVPQSLLTKAQVYGTAGPWAGRHWWEWLSPAPTGRWPAVGDTNLLVVLSVVTAPAFVVGVRELVRLRRTALAAAVGGALAVWLGYALLGVAYFWWYLAVPLGGIVAAAAVGLPRIVRGPAIYVSMALAVLGIWSVGQNLYRGRAQGEIGFARVAHYLQSSARPGETVLLEPIGVIGYSAPVRVVDEVGLVSPRVAERRLRGPGWYADIVAEERPEWLVVRQFVTRTGAGFAGTGELFRDAAERDSLFTRYPRVYPVDGEPGDQDLVVLRRAR